jgi:alpha-D-ribose 1-methylphosphonate 5-triphosphate diphosphatase
VFDAIRVGMDEDTKLTSIDMQTLGKAICESQAAGRLRAEHSASTIREHSKRPGRCS